MELVVFVGVQASGKSSFFAHRFADTHVRINLDMLRTRHRERQLLARCLEIQQPVVIDNTNVRVAERAPYISAARGAGFSVHGFYFESRIDACLARNASRTGRSRLPDAAVRSGHARLEIPSLDEGFDSLTYVRLHGDGRFSEEPWVDEVR